MVALFWDEGAGVFYDVGTDHERLIVRPRDTFDNAVPSGGSSAAEALHRLATLTGNEDYARTAARLLRSVVPLLSRYPLGFGNWLKVAELSIWEPSEVAIVGAPGDPATRQLLRVLHRRYAPWRTVVCLDPSEAHAFPSPILEGRGQVDGKPTAYVCYNYACELPTTEPDVLEAQLSG